MPARTHGHTVGRARSPEYKAWLNMRNRVENPRAPRFADYGGAGVTITSRWRTFEQFLADMGTKPTPAHTLDRIDNLRGYSPDNCRWATRKEQQNNRRITRRMTVDGVTKPLTVWAEESGIPLATFYCRLNRGMDPAEVLRRGRSRMKVVMEYDGRRQSMKEWAAELGVSMGLLSERRLSGWSDERNLSTPPRTVRRADNS